MFDDVVNLADSVENSHFHFWLVGQKQILKIDLVSPQMREKHEKTNDSVYRGETGFKLGFIWNKFFYVFEELNFELNDVSFEKFEAFDYDLLRNIKMLDDILVLEISLCLFFK